MKDKTGLARKIIETTHLLSQKGLVVGSAGNVSARLEGSSFLITPSGLPYEDIVPEDLVVVDLDGMVISGNQEPSKELGLHRAVYRARPDAKAVIHAHSPYASALAVNRLGLPAVVDELIFKTGGPIEVAEYGYPGSEDLAQKLVVALGDRQAALLANHGLVCLGRSLREALAVCEVVEEAAKIYVLARNLGQVHVLDAEVIRRQQAAFREKMCREA